MSLRIVWQLSDTLPLSRVLARLPEELQARVKGRVTMKAAKPIVRALRAAAPASPTRRSRPKTWTRRDGTVGTGDYGTLRQNITARLTRRSKAATRISTGDAFWGYFIEKGWTLTRGAKGGAQRRIKRIAPNPFWNRGLAAGAPEATRIMREELQKEIAAAAQRFGSTVGLQAATGIRRRA